MKLISAVLFLALGSALAAGCGALSTSTSTAAAAPARGHHVITHPRLCAAVAVYEQAQADDWSLRALVANATLNGYRAAGQVPDCGERLDALLTAGLDTRRWQNALDAVDAVSSGDYSIVPDACARANTVVPLSTAPDSPPVAANPLAAARAQCVTYNLAFVEAQP